MYRQKAISFIAPIFAAVALLAASTSPSLAQSNNQSTIGALGNLFGALAQAGAKSKAQKGWAQVNPQMTQCVNTMFSGKNVTVDHLIAAGIAPDDQRIVPVINACNQFLSAKPRTNFPCTVTNSKGQQVGTTCNESYAKEVNGSLVALSGDDVLKAVANGDKLVAANFETAEASAARLSAERSKYQVSPPNKPSLQHKKVNTSQTSSNKKIQINDRSPIFYNLYCSDQVQGPNETGHRMIYVKVNCQNPIDVMTGLQKLIQTLESRKDRNVYRFAISTCKSAYKEMQMYVNGDFRIESIPSRVTIQDCGSSLYNSLDY
jgi:hypothetical protein